ncbi:hypothetical protein MTX20_37560 [Bradyrhizobium sp. ISRA435]|nr:hypothetical protein MTX20_37560 [Bradyrhizobium sp. ISRA435]
MGHTIGLVLSNFDWAMSPLKDEKAECPDGPVHTNRQNWEAQFPSRSARQDQLNRCWRIDNRGPDCENAFFNPGAVSDPLPFREVQSPVASGFNLDGTLDGEATATTCGHKKFREVTTGQRVDNQLFRFFGCHRNLVNNLFSEANTRKFVQAAIVNRLLLEISGVTDDQNSPDVEVTLYRGSDQLLVDSARKIVPWQSQHVSGQPLYRAKGQIVDGQLVTEAADGIWPETYIGVQRVRGMTLHLKLSSAGAEGMRAGYVELDPLWEWYAHFGIITSAGEVYMASPPSAYAALHRLADGYKDPQTGQCTALSSALRIEFVRAFIIHPPGETDR